MNNPEIKKYKPITPGLRQRILIKEPNLWKGKPHKNLVCHLKTNSGRNHAGKITVRHRGGGHKRLYRKIDFKREIGLYSINKVVRLEYDPNRSSNIALCITPNNKYFYIIAPANLKVNDTFHGRYVNKELAFTLDNGESLALQDIPIGTLIHNVELKPGQGGKIARAAGAYCTLLENLENGMSILRTPANKKIIVPSTVLATIGQVSNASHNKRVIGKAGRNRWLGKRPTVRGEAMNPIDHPHGGKSHGHGGLNTQPRTPWGKLAKKG